jgi:hypothetical protein
MGDPTPRSTGDIIEAANTRPLTPIADFWRHLSHIKFHLRYRDALIQAGISEGKAAEIGEVLRIHIERIVEGIENATYAMREIVGEVDDMRRQAASAQPGDARFKV